MSQSKQKAPRVIEWRRAEGPPWLFDLIDGIVRDTDFWSQLENDLKIVVPWALRRRLLTMIGAHHITQARLPRQQEAKVRGKLVRVIEAFLSDMEAMRTNDDVVVRAVFNRFVFPFDSATPPIDDLVSRYEPPIYDRTKCEQQLLEVLRIARAQSRSRGRGAPSKQREVLFCAFFAAFKAAGGNPTANWNTGKDGIDGAFVQFCTRVVGRCPTDVSDALQKGLASALRSQLRTWRRNPKSAYGPCGEASLKMLEEFTAAAAAHCEQCSDPPHVSKS
jgi:hypothetical protein